MKMARIIRGSKTLPQMLEAKVIEQAKALGNFAEEEA